MANSDIHLKMDIKGESTDDKHKDEIDVLSYSWGASNPGSMFQGSGGGIGKVSFSDLNFTHNVDKASPNLWKACATLEHIKEATLTSTKQGKGPQDYMIFTMSDVIITSVSIAESSGGSPPMENVSMQFAKMKFEYKPQKNDGQLDAPVTFDYDVKANKLA